jgi:hypothetical protein
VFQTIQFEVAGPQLQACFPFAAQQRPAASAKLMQAERLDHQVVGSKVEAADARVNLLAGSQHQNREVEIERPDLLKNLLTVLDRHVQIEDREVRQILPKGLDGGSAIIGKANAMPVCL